MLLYYLIFHIQNIEHAQEKKKKAYDKRVRVTDIKRDFKEGDKVLLADQSKKRGLKPRFKGPFIVQSVTPHGNVKFRESKNSHHPKNLKKFVEGRFHYTQNIKKKYN